MYILWQPETGKCSYCGRKSRAVRRFTDTKTHSIFCHTCWRQAQRNKVDYVVNKQEWKDDSAITFECEISEKHGTTQDVVWH